MAAKKTTYLGARGYTILKSDLNEEEELKLRKENTVKPFSPKHMVQTQTTEFPVYRESTTKFYLRCLQSQNQNLFYLSIHSSLSSVIINTHNVIVQQIIIIIIIIITVFVTHSHSKWVY